MYAFHLHIAGSHWRPPYHSTRIRVNSDFFPWLMWFSFCLLQSASIQLLTLFHPGSDFHLSFPFIIYTSERVLNGRFKLWKKSPSYHIAGWIQKEMKCRKKSWFTPKKVLMEKSMITVASKNWTQKSSFTTYSTLPATRAQTIFFGKFFFQPILSCHWVRKWI